MDLNNLSPEERALMGKLIQKMLPAEKLNEFEADFDSSTVILEETKKFMADASNHPRIRELFDDGFILAMSRLLSGGEIENAEPFSNREMLIMEATVLLTLVRQRVVDNARNILEGV